MKTISCEVCGKDVVLDGGFTCFCQCGAKYNSFGQLLASTDQWGLETGENIIDIYNSDDKDWY